MRIIETKTEIDVSFLVVNENGTVTSTHKVKAETDLTGDGFIESLEALLETKDKLEKDDSEVKALMRTGKVLTLGYIQAATLGIQSQYQLPTSLGTTGQVIAYQGAQGLQWITVGSQGNQGLRGLQGIQGNQGLQGFQAKAMVGGLFLPFQFDNDTTAAAPAAGKLKFNNANFNLVTNILVHDQDRNTADHDSLQLNNFKNNSTVLISSEDSAKFGFYVITNVTDNTTYRTYAVTYVGSLSTVFSNNDNIMLMIGTNGFQGTQGFQGVGGLTGLQGDRGFQGSRGLQGLQGYNGFVGAQGQQGFPGFPGDAV